ncbi:MAG: hypothetical protein Q7S58_15900 [Candidatus Binatus sp.]|uniref:hypothetical protein n=1 Tax=Candidatus Binatus sp. TaxID=2811406 RepID=UPI00271685D7|nr:hypothetical protein [Candidatus Binatus sp.]MDO8433881.1 hypothetical protein [Candidatus Binatus sp.]
MKLLKLAKSAALASAIAIVATAPSLAAEARPWLCRDKPVFSYDRSMEYSVAAQPGRQWRIFFMQFSPDAAHDGFQVTNSRELPPRGDPLTGRLDPGRYFTVALYRSGSGAWICPGYTHDDRNPGLGELSKLCYGEDGPPCLVNLTVKPDHNLAQPPPPTP